MWPHRGCGTVCPECCSGHADEWSPSDAQLSVTGLAGPCHAWYHWHIIRGFWERAGDFTCWLRNGEGSPGCAGTSWGRLGVDGAVKRCGQLFRREFPGLRVPLSSSLTGVESDLTLGGVCLYPDSEATGPGLEWHCGIYMQPVWAASCLEQGPHGWVPGSTWPPVQPFTVASGQWMGCQFQGSVWGQAWVGALHLCVWWSKEQCGGQDTLLNSVAQARAHFRRAVSQLLVSLDFPAWQGGHVGWGQCVLPGIRISAAGLPGPDHQASGAVAEGEEE